MPRPRKPWYRKTRNTWFVEIDGKQVSLAKGAHNRAAAEKEFHRLMTLRDEPDASLPQNSVISLFGRFLGWTKKHKSPATYEQLRYFLRSFIHHPGVKKLRPERITIPLTEAWLDAHPKWKASRRHAAECLLRAFNWGVRRGMITKNPIAAIELPVRQRVLRYLTTEQRKQLFEATKDQAFKNFLTALAETGCRPGEVCGVTAAEVNLELGVWVLKSHKTGKKTGKPRIVYLTDKMLALSKELMAQNPSGPLFLNSRKKPWNRNAVRCRFRVFRKRFPEFGHFTAYSYRRAFVTDALERGVDVVKVAELVGHSGTDMVMRHYNQLQERVVHMREMANKATT